MENRKPVLKWRDYLKISLRSYFLQDAFNYGTYCGEGYAYVIFPALQKIYADNPEMLKSTTIENMEFFNTNLQMLPFLTSLHLAMLDAGETPENARSVKLALMGPISGVASSTFQFGLAPLFSSVGAGLAQQGLIIGPILFFLAINLCILFTKIFVGYSGYKIGTSVIESLKEKMDSISHLAYIVGITVVSGLSVSFTKVKLGIQYASQMPNGKQNVVSLQSILDKISPKMLPALLVIFMFVLHRKYKWSVYKMLVLIFVVGILGSMAGIFV